MWITLLNLNDSDIIISILDVTDFKLEKAGSFAIKIFTKTSEIMHIHWAMTYIKWRGILNSI